LTSFGPYSILSNSFSPSTIRKECDKEEELADVVDFGKIHFKFFLLLKFNFFTGKYYFNHLSLYTKKMKSRVKEIEADYLNAVRLLKNSDEITRDVAIERFDKREAWITSELDNELGNVAVFLFRKFMVFFPKFPNVVVHNPRKTTNKILTSLPKIILRILTPEEQCGDNDWVREDSEEESFLTSNLQFKCLANSQTFRKLFVNSQGLFYYFFKKIYYKKCKKSNSSRRRVRNMTQIMFYVAAYRQLFMRFFNSSPLLKRYLILRIGTLNVERMRLSQIFEKIKFLEIYKKARSFYAFDLGLQKYFLRFAVPDTLLYLQNYKERENIILKMIRENVNPRYVHLMHEIFKSQNSDIYQDIRDIHSGSFPRYTEQLAENCQLYLMNGDISQLDIFSSLFYDYTLTKYIEVNTGMSNWSKTFKAMSVTEFFQKIEFKYPMIVRLVDTLYGVVFKNCIYIGNVFEAYAKYAYILDTAFGCNLHIYEVKKETMQVGKNKNELRVVKTNLEKHYNFKKFFQQINLLSAL
jgi:hypothetical protein